MEKGDNYNHTLAILFLEWLRGSTGVWIELTNNRPLPQRN
jgi:hypothetical protein